MMRLRSHASQRNCSGIGCGELVGLRITAERDLSSAAASRSVPWSLSAACVYRCKTIPPVFVFSRVDTLFSSGPVWATFTGPNVQMHVHTSADVARAHRRESAFLRGLSIWFHSEQTCHLLNVDICICLCNFHPFCVNSLEAVDERDRSGR